MSRVINYDKLGVVAGSACAIHCLVSGVALSILSVAGFGFIASEPLEIGFLATTFVLGVIGVIHGFRKHRTIYPSVIFIAAMIAVVTGHQMVGHNHELAAQHPMGTVVSVLGGMLLVTFHIANIWLGRRNGCATCAH